MVLVPVGGLYGSQYLPRDAEFGERPKRGLLLEVEVSDGLEEADHALLDDILSFRARQEVAARLGPSEVPVAGEQDLSRAFSYRSPESPEVVQGLPQPSNVRTLWIDRAHRSPEQTDPHFPERTLLAARG